MPGFSPGASVEARGPRRLLVQMSGGLAAGADRHRHTPKGALGDIGACHRAKTGQEGENADSDGGEEHGLSFLTQRANIAFAH